MRDSYRHKMEGSGRALTMMHLVRTAVERANRALFEADLDAAQAVISGDEVLDQMYDDLDARCLALLATEQPVAGELRTLVALTRMCADLARMGDLAAHVAKIARMRYPEHVVVRSRLTQHGTVLGRIAAEMVGMAATALSSAMFDARLMAEHDDEADDLRTQQFKVLLSDEWADGVRAAVDAALLGRYLERIADHAVLIGSRVVYIVTGSAPRCAMDDRLSVSRRFGVQDPSQARTSRIGR